MRWQPLILAACGMWLSVVGYPRPACAQFQPGVPQGVPQPQMIDAGGIVTDISPRDMRVMITDGAGSGAILDFSPNRIHNGVTYTGGPPPQARVVGTMGREALVPGLIVRVSGKVKQLEELTEPITQADITGLQINPTGTYGAFPEAVLGITPEEEAAGVAGYVLSGQITRVRGDRISIVVPLPDGDTTTIVGELADEVSVSIDVPGLQLVSRGDRVNFNGMSVDGQLIFVYNATFTKPDPQNLNAEGQAAAGGFVPDQPPEQRPFGIPDDGQDDAAPEAEPADEPAPEDTAMEEGAMEEVEEAAEAAQPEKPGRVVRIN